MKIAKLIEFHLSLLYEANFFKKSFSKLFKIVSVNELMSWSIELMTSSNNPCSRKESCWSETVPMLMSAYSSMIESSSLVIVWSPKSALNGICDLAQ